MDYSEATKVVHKRIAELSPQNASKVLGYILLRNEGVAEMLRLVNAPTQVLKTLIDEAEQTLCSSPNVPNHSSSYIDKDKKPLVVSHFPTEFTPFVPSSFPPQPMITHHLQHYPPPPSPSLHNLPPLGSSIFNAPFHELGNCKQVCADFSRGYCTNGGNCRLLHLSQMENGDFMVLNPRNQGDVKIPDHVPQSGSLKHLEMELVELLRCRRGIPVSISSIPILYFDKYAMPLQVEGYLLEGRNKDEFICTMRKLVAQMGKTICILDRPHGRPSLTLAEELTNIQQRSDGGHGPESRVYMTFRPESMFSEQDAHNYFENFGPVKEVRIPCQVNRMFGFVTFVYPETAALVLTKTNHVIRGSQVMVKPYRLNPMHTASNTHSDA